jgi:hypothetical protein
MLNFEMVPWLLADSNVATPVSNRIYLEQIPQSVTARPCIVVGGMDNYNDGTTGNVVLEQKLVWFRIHVHGENASSLITPVNRLLTKLQSIINGKSQVVIGSFRVQCLQVQNLESGSLITDNQVNDRRMPGAPEQNFHYVCIPVFASYHATT